MDGSLPAQNNSEVCSSRAGGKRKPSRLPLEPIAAPTASLFYRFGLGVVAVTMLILPLFYLALTIAAGWAVYYFALHCVPAIWNWDIRFTKVAIVAKFICMVTPLVVGSAIAFFMIKPIFSRRRRPPVSAVLNPKFEPRVAELIDDVCRLVGAPSPRRIELDCDINASASFDLGLGGFVRSRLVLRLGLPLVAALTQRELAGVVAHEFGHFRQGAGLRFSYLIRGVNGWFARVIYDRDRWDDAIESSTESESGWIAFMSVFANLGIAVSRGVLWLLMMIGHGVSAFLMRQMEYDADLAEIRLAGSETFKSTARKLSALSVVQSEVEREVSEIWQYHRHLPDNLPILLDHRQCQLPDHIRSAIEASLHEGKTGWADTHPSLRDRMRFAEKLAQRGLEFSDGAARELFQDFPDISRAVTLGHYHNLGVPNPTELLIPVSQLISPEPLPDTPAAAPAALPARRTIAFNPDLATSA